MSRSFIIAVMAIVGVVAFQATTAFGQYVVPGTGKLIDFVGDDFENPEWRFINQGAKSSKENDEQTRGPLGYSANGRWAEGPERGYPDLMKVVSTPEGGIEGSQYSLLLRTLYSGVPGRISNDIQQDDLIVNVSARIGSTIRVSEMPNCVVRVYLPPPEQWENRSGPQFGIRTGVTTTTRKQVRAGLFGSRSEVTSEPYWPGMWIHFRSETSRNVETDSAYLKVRGDSRGRDFQVRELDQWGWWTFGMSYTGDGRVHYFASPGVDPLTREDYLTSQYPYGYRAENFRSFFFNVVNQNNGRTWSTPFLIDDPEIYVVNADRITKLVDSKKARLAKRQQSTAKKQSSSSSKSR